MVLKINKWRDKVLKKRFTLITAIILSFTMFYGCDNKAKEDIKCEADANINNNFNEEFSFKQVEEGRFNNYSISKKTYTFNNEKSSNVNISYPVIEIDNNKELSNKVNEAIKRAAFLNYNESEIKDEYNANIIGDYTIVYTSEDVISIFFNGDWIKGVYERGLTISLEDASIKTALNYNIDKEDILGLMKNKSIAVNNIDLIKKLKEENTDIADYINDKYENYNDEEYNFFVDDNYIYLVTTVAPVEGYYLTLKIPYEFV